MRIPLTPSNKNEHDDDDDEDDDDDIKIKPQLNWTIPIAAMPVWGYITDMACKQGIRHMAQKRPSDDIF